MNSSLVRKLAFRYMRGKGTANAVPVLSRISMVAIAVSSAAMIILFSVFNGFEGLVDQLYRAFYPDIRISAVRGKFFSPDSSLRQQLQHLKEIGTVSYVLQDNVLVNTEEGETIPVTLKGVDREYFDVNKVRPYIKAGNDSLITWPVSTAILGQYIAATLGVDVNSVFDRIQVYYPNPEATYTALSATDAFHSLILKPDGSFAVQEEFDSRYILADLGLVQELMRQPGRYSSIELSVAPGYKLGTVQKALKKALGNAYRVESRFEQNRSVYMVMRTERWAGYAILLFVLLIASFNMIGALSLLVLEKQQDIGILKAMGLESADISRVILLEGMLWSLTGGIAGIVLGLILCFCQSYFHLIRINGAFIIDAYPVTVKAVDILVVLATVAAVGLLAALYPARRAGRRKVNELLAGK